MGYRVTWEIDVDDEDAKTPYEAAKKAMAAMKRKGSIANVFKVAKTDKYGVRLQTSVEIDLSEPNPSKKN